MSGGPASSPRSPLPSGVVSPWQTALGDELAGLEPRLASYFGAIPPGSVGRGEGTFDSVGTPRRWLWPLLAILGRAGIAFPVWQHSVPFTVVNSPRDGEVDAVRTFRFAAGERVMVDSIGVRNGVLTDRLGVRDRIEAQLEPTVVDGHLELRSSRVTVRLGRVRVPVPSPIAPRVELSEQYDIAAGVQRVSLALRAPIIGRIYEYTGSFHYSITREK